MVGAVCRLQVWHQADVMNVMTLSAALSFGSLLTDTNSLQTRLAMVVLVRTSLPSSEEITEEDCA